MHTMDVRRGKWPHICFKDPDPELLNTRLRGFELHEAPVYLGTQSRFFGRLVSMCTMCLDL
eukprot:SAG11_NODE_1419_length_4957_cov_3.968711_5_plen_61_part_00